MAEYIPYELLPEKVITVSYQLLGLRPATTIDDTDMQHGWRSYAIPERSFTVPGRLVQTINPTIPTQILSQPYYSLESSFLVALLDGLPIRLRSERNPETTTHQFFPIPRSLRSQVISSSMYWLFQNTNSDLGFMYLGKACFIGENGQESVDVAIFNSTNCPACGPDSTLDLSKGQRLLEHIAAHILHGSKIERCGLCLRSSS